MKKTICAILAGLMLVGCGTATSSGEEIKEQAESVVQEVQNANIDTDALVSTAQEALSGEEQLKILVPSGAPALATAPAFLGADVEVVDGADALQAAFVNPTPQYDVILAPVNLGMKLASAGKTTYKLLGVVTWGNVYIVAEKGTSTDPSTWTDVAAFGEQAGPGKLFSAVYGSLINADEITWYNSAAEAGAALASVEVKVAMLAEPAASVIISKAKENGIDLEVIADVQEAYSGSQGNGFPQAGLFVEESFYENKKEQIDALFTLMQTFAKEAASATPKEISDLIDLAGGAEKFGVPSSEIIGNVWNKLNINVTSAEDAKAALEEYAPMFDIDNIDAAIIQK